MENIIKALNDKESGIQIAADLSKKDIVIIKLEGTLDTFNSNDFVDTSLEILERSKLESLVFDLEDFMYISTTGIYSIIKITIECLSRNKKVFLLNIEKKIFELFKLLGFNDQFRVIDNLLEIATSSKSTFPRKEFCIECNGKLNLFKPGKFKCPSCKQIFKIDDMGLIEHFRR